jgi:hypothetical protein
MGKVFTAGFGPTGGRLYRIDPTEPAGTVTRVVSSGLGIGAEAMAFDGHHIWVTTFPTTVFLVTPGPTIPWAVTAAPASFVNPRGLAWDGTNVWATDYGAGTIVRLDSSGAALQTVTVQGKPLVPMFDGTNRGFRNPSGFCRSSGLTGRSATVTGLWVPMTRPSTVNGSVTVGRAITSRSSARRILPLGVVNTGDDTFRGAFAATGSAFGSP